MAAHAARRFEHFHLDPRRSKSSGSSMQRGNLEIRRSIDRSEHAVPFLSLRETEGRALRCLAPTKYKSPRGPINL